jgi:hypothetical protein
MHPKLFWPLCGLMVILVALIHFGVIPDTLSDILKRDKGDQICTITSLMPYRENCVHKGPDINFNGVNHF